MTQLEQDIAQRREKIKELEKTIESIKKEREAVRLKGVSYRNQIAILDNRIEQVRLDVEATREKITVLALELEALELDISEKEKTVDRQKKIVGEFIRMIHQEGQGNFITVLAAYDTFSDFYNQVQYLKRVDRDLGKSLIALREAKQALEERHNQTAQRKDSYEKTKETLEDQRKDLEEQIFSKEDLLTQTHASEFRFNTLLENLKKQYQQIEGEISGIEREVRRRANLEQELKQQEGGAGSGLLSWPTQSRYITARFHDPDYPYRHIFEHNAIDIRAAHGTSVKAAASGYIARAKQCTSASCYSFIMIVHSDGISTVYGHVSRLSVSEGQFVTRGDVIGLSGGTPGTVGAGPFVTGAHLHFEVRKNGIPVDPVAYLVKDY